jgi:hypothetical protein
VLHLATPIAASPDASGLSLSADGLDRQLVAAGCRTPSSGSGSPCGDDGTLTIEANGASGSGSDGSNSGANGSNGGGGGGVGHSREYVHVLLVANNSKDSQARYNAIFALINHCKDRSVALKPGDAADWGRDPACLLLCEILQVGEALAAFCDAPPVQRSGEARAVLAADYKRLLWDYTHHLGAVLVPGACCGAAPEIEVGRLVAAAGHGGSYLFCNRACRLIYR